MAAPVERLIYVMDTSSWITIEGHPAQNRIIAALQPLIEMGRIKSPPQVWSEFRDTSEIFAWIEPYRDRIVEIKTNEPNFLALVGRITHENPGMTGARGTKDKADPWVIALAAHTSSAANVRVIVCDESSRKRPGRKIPGVCGRYQVACMRLLEMLDREYPEDGWLDD